MSAGRRIQVQSFVLATVSVTVSLGAKPAQAEGECSIVHRLDTSALLHTFLPCLQTCQTYLTIPATHSRWLKVCQKTELHLALCNLSYSLLTCVTSSAQHAQSCRFMLTTSSVASFLLSIDPALCTVLASDESSNVHPCAWAVRSFNIPRQRLAFKPSSSFAVRSSSATSCSTHFDAPPAITKSTCGSKGARGSTCSLKTLS